MLKSSIIRNVGLCFSLWFVGLTVTLIPVIYGIVAFRGFCLGYTISSAIGVLGVGNGILFSISSLLLQNILVIPATLALAVSGIRLYKAIIKDRKKENLKIEILRAYNLFKFNVRDFISSFCYGGICIIESIGNLCAIYVKDFIILQMASLKKMIKQ